MEIGRRWRAVLGALAIGGGGCPDRDAPPRAASPEVALAPPRPTFDVTAWLAWSPTDMGCWLERSLSYRDPGWNCSTRHLPARTATRCDPGRADGPEIPDALAPRLDPRLRGVELTWDRGVLQEVVFSFAPGTSLAEMRRVLGVGGRRLEGAASQGPAECDTPCYDVVAFQPEDPCDGGDEAAPAVDEP